MKRADVCFLTERLVSDIAPEFAKMPGDDTAVGFCEMQCILAVAAIREILRASTPESREDFCRRWMQSAEERTKQMLAASAKPARKCRTKAAHKAKRRATK